MLRAYRGILPRVHPSAYIDRAAHGDVEIGEESSVWMCAVVRGDVNHIRIGRRSNLQDGTIVHVMKDTHPTLIGDAVTVGHGAVLHGCIVDDRCVVGMRVTPLNGVHVGSDSIVAAGALLVEGAEIPPRSPVMGSPGKVTRALTADEIATIQMYADRYVSYRLDYLGGT